MRSILGYVYFMRDESSGLIKIGFSNDPERRRQHLEWSEKTTITILATVAATRDLESRLHQILKPIRHHGEWYAPSPYLSACIKVASGEPWSSDPPHYRRKHSTPSHWFLERVTDRSMLPLLVESAKAFRPPVTEPQPTAPMPPDALAYWGDWAYLL
jgi:hypothetical protein